MSAWSAVEDVVISRPPNSMTTPEGILTGCAIAPWSISPYVANASVVAGVYTGSSTFVASETPGADTPSWTRAVPGFSAAIANRSSARSLAATLTRCPGPPVTRALVARTTTATSIGLSVWFCSTTGSSKRSPKLRKRGGLGRTMSGSRAVTVDSPEPNCRSACTATAITR